MALSSEQRFWKKVKKTDTCWEWVAAKIWSGYGHFGFRGKVWTAHRVSWVLHNGEIPVGMYVLHTCDNRACVNPEHLWLGTIKDNAIDMVKKGRNFVPNTRGEKAPGSKLKWADIPNIKKLRELGATQSEISTMYGIHQSQVSRILTGGRGAWTKY